MKKIIAFCLLSLSFLNSRAESNPENPDPATGKIYFSDQPFTTTNTGSKMSFTSGNYIYARLDVEGSTIKETFRMKETENAYPYLVAEVHIMKNGQTIEYRGNNYLLINAEDMNASKLSFDILPEPVKSTTLYSMTDDFTAGYGYVPLYSLIIGEKLPEGNYTVKVKIFYRALDGWGKELSHEEWPYIEGEFQFNFSENDISKIVKDDKLARDILYENAFRYDKLPAVFSNPGKLTDPAATTAKVSAILKRDLPGRAIIKFVAEQYNGAYWSIAKDDYGLPKYKYFNPHIWMAYKMDGKCYVGYVTLRQVYSGGGTYGPLQVAWTSTKDDKGIDCGNVKQ